jgi:hypothetical protein
VICSLLLARGGALIRGQTRPCSCVIREAFLFSSGRPGSGHSPSDCSQAAVQGGAGHHRPVDSVSRAVKGRHTIDIVKGVKGPVKGVP